MKNAALVFLCGLVAACGGDVVYVDSDADVFELGEVSAGLRVLPAPIVRPPRLAPVHVERSVPAEYVAPRDALVSEGKAALRREIERQGATSVAFEIGPIATEPVRFCDRDVPRDREIVVCWGDDPDLEALAKLPKLVRVRLVLTYKAQAALDLSPLAEVEGLIDLSISGPRGAVVSGLSALRRVERLELYGVTLAPGEIVELDHVEALIIQDMDDVQLGALPSLSRLVAVATNEDMLEGITRYQTLERLMVAGAHELRGLNELPLLRELDLSQGAWAVDGLAGLRGIERLVLTYAEDLGFVRNMPKLRSLKVNGEALTTLAPLRHHRNLEELEITNAELSRWTPLATLRRLHSLSVEDSNFNSLGSLKTLALQHVNLSGTPVKHVRALARIDTLETLQINRTEVKNLRPLRRLESLRWIDAKDTPLSTCSLPGTEQPTQTCDRNLTPLHDAKVDVTLWEEPGC